MPVTLFCWTNVPKMKLIDGPVMSGSDWLSDCNNIVPHCPCRWICGEDPSFKRFELPVVAVIATIITPDVDGPLRS